MIFGKRVVFFDLQGYFEEADITSKNNPTEARLTATLCKYIQDELGKQTGIGIISPYKSQIDLLSKQINQESDDANGFYEVVIDGKKQIFCIDGEESDESESALK